MYLNSYEIDVRARQFRDDPVLGPATQTLANLRDWVNQNSDGWAYWVKPSRAALKLQHLIERAAVEARGSRAEHTVTAAEYRAALVPIRAFKTRHSATFEIVTMAQLSLFGRNT